MTLYHESGRKVAGRSFDNWKHMIIKRLKRRAMTFQAEAVNADQRVAWEMVIEWLDSFHKGRAYLTEHGSIGLKGDDGRGL